MREEMVAWKVKVEGKGNRLKIGLRAVFPWAHRLFRISLGLKLTQLPAGAGADKKTPFCRRFVQKSKSILRKCGIGRKRFPTRHCFSDLSQMFGGVRVWRVLGVVSLLALFNCSILHFVFSLF